MSQAEPHLRTAQRRGTSARARRGASARSPVQATWMLAAWHAGWAVAVSLTALLARWFSPVDDLVILALLIAAVPGVAGTVLMVVDGLALRFGLLCGWLLAAVATAGLTGGVTGAVPGLLAIPLAAGIALDYGSGRSDRLTRVGAGGAALTVICGLISVWLLPPAPADPVLASASVILVLLAVLAAVTLTSKARYRLMAGLRAERDNVERVLHAQPALTLVLDATGQVEGCWGEAPPAIHVRELRDRGLIAHVHAPDRPLVIAALGRAAKVRAAGSAPSVEVMFTPRGAMDRRVLMVVRALDAHRLIAQVLDGTAQFARELGLENARFEAEAQNAGKTRFLANMSHELRTPLNAVIGFADIMRQRLFGDLPVRYQEYANSIFVAGSHLLDMINDVLDLSKIEAERYELALAEFDARDAVSEAVALVRVQADEKGVTLANVMPPVPMRVMADRRALKQIALNLLSNAVKFTAGGGSVAISLDAIGPYMELSVVDTGVGIASEDLVRIGRPFEQAGRAEQKAQGTGLGLSLVRSLAELHGGRVSIDSALGEGTAILVRLPVVDVAAKAELVEAMLDGDTAGA